MATNNAVRRGPARRRSDSRLDTLLAACPAVRYSFAARGDFRPTFSEAWMDYTIIGGAVNLAARLQAHAEPGRILLSHETWSLVRDAVTAEEHPAIEVKGIAKPVRCYLVQDETAEEPQADGLIREERDGLRLQLDLGRFDAEAAARVLEGVLARLRQ